MAVLVEDVGHAVLLAQYRPPRSPGLLQNRGVMVKLCNPTVWLCIQPPLMMMVYESPQSRSSSPCPPTQPPTPSYPSLISRADQIDRLKIQFNDLPLCCV